MHLLVNVGIFFDGKKAMLPLLRTIYGEGKDRINIINLID